eukprot:SAG11_NODE_3218_length_2603_cov_2.582268_1_plen_110_part_00
MYTGINDQAATLHAVADEVWEWLLTRKWIVSVNDSGSNWDHWLGVVHRHPDLRLMCSHLVRAIRIISARRNLGLGQTADTRRARDRRGQRRWRNMLRAPEVCAVLTALN